MWRRGVSEAAGCKVAVVMPALNAAETIAETVGAIPREWVDEIVVVDDGSTDATADVARELDVRVVWHPHNAGYGANQKTCYLDVLQRDAEVIVMLHPDGQYEPALIPELIRPILDDEADLVLGSRMMVPGAARAGGMPLYKRIANRALTGVENRVMRTSLTDLHTGYRAYSRRVLLTIPFLRNANDFSFDSEMLMQASELGFRIAEVPATSRYFRDASSVGPVAATVYGLKTLWAATRLLGRRLRFAPPRAGGRE
jgi:glycosyltransferase involved in cell wall biosynthesis